MQAAVSCISRASEVKDKLYFVCEVMHVTDQLLFVLESDAGSNSPASVSTPRQFAVDR